KVQAARGLKPHSADPAAPIRIRQLAVGIIAALDEQHIDFVCRMNAKFGERAILIFRQFGDVRREQFSIAAEERGINLEIEFKDVLVPKIRRDGLQRPGVKSLNSSGLCAGYSFNGPQ